MYMYDTVRTYIHATCTSTCRLIVKNIKIKMKKREQEKDIGLGRKRKKRNIHKCV